MEAAQLMQHHGYVPAKLSIHDVYTSLLESMSESLVKWNASYQSRMPRSVPAAQRMEWWYQRQGHLNLLLVVFMFTWLGMLALLGQQNEYAFKCLSIVFGCAMSCLLVIMFWIIHGLQSILPKEVSQQSASSPKMTMVQPKRTTYNIRSWEWTIVFEQ